MQSQPTCKLLFLRRRKRIPEPIPIKSELRQPENGGREKGRANEKQRCGSKQKRAHNTFSKRGKRKYSESVKVESRKVKRLCFFGAIHSFGHGHNAVVCGYIVALPTSMIHAENTEYGNADKAGDKENCEQILHMFIISKSPARRNSRQLRLLSLSWNRRSGPPVGRTDLRILAHGEAQHPSPFFLSNADVPFRRCRVSCQR